MDVGLVAGRTSNPLDRPRRDRDLVCHYDDRRLRRAYSSTASSWIRAQVRLLVTRVDPGREPVFSARCLLEQHADAGSDHSGH